VISKKNTARNQYNNNDIDFGSQSCTFTKLDYNSNHLRLRIYPIVMVWVALHNHSGITALYALLVNIYSEAAPGPFSYR
jgi:hypothetical protein